MFNYLQYLQTISNPRTFQRKRDYFRYNYGKFFLGQTSTTQTILEIGPGLGEFVAYVNGLGIKNIDVIDNDRHILEYIKTKFNIHQCFQADDLSTITKELGMYDIIVLTQVFEHIPKVQYKAFLTILTQHLNKDGVLIITVPNMANLFTICERYADLTHYNGFTDAALLELTRYCEIEHVTTQVQGFKIPPYSVINIIRIGLQKVLFGIMLMAYIINGGGYSKLLTPNITLVIKKHR